MLKINRLYDRIEKFLQKYKMEEYLFYSGRKRELNFSDIFKEYKDIFSVDVLRDLIKTDINDKDFNQRKMKYLREFLLQHFLDRELGEYFDNVETILSNKKIKLSSGEELSYFAACVKQINISDRKSRLEIEERKKEIFEKLNESLKIIHNKTFEIVDKIGGGDLISLFQRAIGIDFSQLEGVLKDFIDMTEDIYYQELENTLNEYLNINPNEAFYFDMGFLGRNKDFDAFFPKERMIDIVKETVEDMGLDYTANGSISFDLEEREGKSIYGFCSAIKIPEQIVLVCVPLGGVKDYGQFLHELGHALHFGYTDPKLHFAFKRLGDTSVSEGYASMFDHLIYNPYWLENKLGLKDERLKRYLKIMWLHKMYLLRMFIGEFLYNIKLWKSPELSGKEKIYSDIMSNTTRIKFPEYLYLEEISPHFSIVKYIKAEIFEAAIYQFFTENYGDMWFKNKSVGEFLMHLWKDGEKYYTEEITEKIGIKTNASSLLSERMIKLYNEIQGESE